jgi:hypothetical protein
MADDPVFRAGGLASGLDTNAIIDGLTKLEQRPLDRLRTQQTGFKTQVSLIGTLVSKIGTFYSAAKALSEGGALGVKITSTNTDFTATPHRLVHSRSPFKIWPAPRSGGPPPSLEPPRFAAVPWRSRFRASATAPSTSPTAKGWPMSPMTSRVWARR